MTDFRRALRYHQARWREANGHPIGSQPIAPTRRQAVPPRREPPPARVRARDRRELRHRRRPRRGEGANVGRRAAPELRSPALLGRPPLVADARLQPVRRHGRRRRARRPGRPHVVAGLARHRARGPLRALAGPLRSRLPQQPPRVRHGVRARPRRRDARNRRHRRQLPRARQARDAEAQQHVAQPGGRRTLGRLCAGRGRRARGATELA